MSNYRNELIQVAAVALAAAQVADVDTTDLGVSNEGIQGRFSLERLLDAVRNERRKQELTWGTRTLRDSPPARWLLILLEEVGEVADEIIATVPSGERSPLVAKASLLGAEARAILENGAG